MFYSRPSLVSHTPKIVVGLPPKREQTLHRTRNPPKLMASRTADILNRFYPSWHPKSGKEDVSCEPDARQQMEHARHLAKYVFPRQYGLDSPLASSDSFRSSNVRSPDYLDREREIESKGPCKTPKRLKFILNIMEKMIWRHHKCRYKSLLDLSCPSKACESNVTLSTTPLTYITSLDRQQLPLIAA
ncbi:hypothetical protein BD414DRAFT_428508 [Trametes punicea]|nr:hypothetical protein BD414DRAFT_428508 [Trametes punicea]